MLDYQTANLEMLGQHLRADVHHLIPVGTEGVDGQQLLFVPGHYLIATDSFRY